MYNFIVKLFDINWGYHYDLGLAFGLNLPLKKNLANQVVGKKVKVGIGKLNTSILKLGALILQAILGNNEALSRMKHDYTSVGIIRSYFIVLSGLIGNKLRCLIIEREFQFYWGCAIGSRKSKDIPGCITINLLGLDKKLFLIISNCQGSIQAVVKRSKLEFITGKFVWNDIHLLAELLRFLKAIDLLLEVYRVGGGLSRPFYTYIKVCDVLLKAGIISKVLLIFVPVFDVFNVRMVGSSDIYCYYFIHHFLPVFDLPAKLFYKMVGNEQYGSLWID